MFVSNNGNAHRGIPPRSGPLAEREARHRAPRPGVWEAGFPTSHTPSRGRQDAEGDAIGVAALTRALTVILEPSLKLKVIGTDWPAVTFGIISMM